MQFSNNTLIIDNYPTDQDHLIYNIRTQGMVKINHELRKIIENSEKILPTLRERHSKDLTALHKMGMIVKNEKEDHQNLKFFLNQLKHESKTDSFAVTILTTYACNLKCTYCFEETSRANVKMDAKTADHVMTWLKKQIKKFNYKQLYLIFYGGEPLLNKFILEQIASEMQIWCKKQGIRFKFMLQTNGYLMTPECIAHYLTLGLDQVRISVDGVGQDHDRNRPLRNGRGSFDKIIQNITNCSDMVKIGISTSYTKGNIAPIERLLNYFEEIEILHKLGRFIFSPLHATLGPVGQAEQIQNTACNCNFENKQLLKDNKKIQNLMESRGLPTKNGMSITACPLTSEQGGVTIDQKGHIYKCNSMLGHPEFAVGNIQDEHFNKKHHEFINLDVWKQCPQDCTYLPMCSGGCRMMSFLEEKNFQTAGCKKPYLDKMVPEFIKKEYQTLIASKI